MPVLHYTVSFEVENLSSRNCGTVRRIMWLAATSVFVTSSLAPAFQAPTTYRDHANRFSITVPVGWRIRPLGDSVQVVRGDSYLSVLVFEHTSDVSALVAVLGQKMGNKWQRFQTVGQGKSTLAGFEASTASFSGQNPRGVDSVLKLAGLVSNHTAYVLVIGATKTDLPKVQDTLTQIEHSFSLLGTGKPAPEEPTPTLGMEVTDLSSEDAAGYGLSGASGALVVNLDANGPAQQAGVDLHDVVVTAGGQNIDSAAMLQQVVQSHKPSDSLQLEILRVTENGKVEHKTLRATLAAAPRPK